MSTTNEDLKQLFKETFCTIADSQLDLKQQVVAINTQLRYMATKEDLSTAIELHRTREHRFSMVPGRNKNSLVKVLAATIVALTAVVVALTQLL